jgi:hypothetical protein
VRLRQVLAKQNVQFAMMSEVTKMIAEDKRAPSGIVLVPASRKATQGMPIKQIFQKPMLAFFVDPVDDSLVGGGIKITVPSDKLMAMMPYVKTGMCIAKVALKVGRLASGLPIPDVTEGLSEWINECCANINSLAEGTPQARKLIGDITENLDVTSAQTLGSKLKEPMEKSLDELDRLLPAGWRKQTGLVPLTSEKDGTFAFLCEKDAADFNKHGAALFGHPELRSGSQVDVSDPTDAPAPAPAPTATDAENVPPQGRITIGTKTFTIGQTVTFKSRRMECTATVLGPVRSSSMFGAQRYSSRKVSLQVPWSREPETCNISDVHN